MLALVIPDTYAGPLVVAGVIGLAGMFSWMVRTMLKLTGAVDALAGRVHDLDGKGNGS